MDLCKFKITVGDILYYNQKRIGLLKARTGEGYNQKKTWFIHHKFEGTKLVGENWYFFDEQINQFKMSDLPKLTSKPNPTLYQKIFDIISKQ